MSSDASAPCLILENRTLLASAVGLQGIYYDSPNFMGKSVSRVDSQVNFSWSKAPIGGIGERDVFNPLDRNRHAAAFGEVHVLREEQRRRSAVGESQAVIESLAGHATTVEDKGGITLTARKAYDIQLEYWDNTGTGERRN